MLSKMCDIVFNCASPSTVKRHHVSLPCPGFLCATGRPGEQVGDGVRRGEEGAYLRGGVPGPSDAAHSLIKTNGHGQDLTAQGKQDSASSAGSS